MDATNFDIFGELKLSRRESVLHTPMIAGLLDPLGLHGLGDLFLRRFLALKSVSSPPLALTTKDALDCVWFVKREQNISRGENAPRGCIDILLLCPSKGIAIAIENKIDAPLGSNQLQRYLEWLQKCLPPAFSYTRLLLLTPDGRRPQKMSQQECGAISYADILDCLLQCLNEEPSIAVHSFVRSYAKTLASFPEVSRPQPKWGHSTEPAEELCNVFRFLRISRREDVLHTPVLSRLLDPKGFHNQGAIYLSSFLNVVACLPTVASVEQRRVVESIECDWIIKSEVKLDSRRIDILLCCQRSELLIAIENKIDAPESAKQIEESMQDLRTRFPEFPHQIVVFLTISGSPARSAGEAQVQLVSHEQIRQFVSEHHAKLAVGPVKDMVGAYLNVLKGIIPAPGTKSQQRNAVLRFLEAFKRKYHRTNVRHREKTDGLIAFLDEDVDCNGQYHGIYVWHEDFLHFQHRRLLLIRVAINLSNKKTMGLYVGLRWNMRSIEQNKEERHLSEAIKLLSYAAKIFKVPPAHAANHWFGICDRLEYTRTDEGLVAVLENHESELHYVIASKIRNIWEFCGERLCVLNNQILSGNRDDQ